MKGGGDLPMHTDTGAPLPHRSTAHVRAAASGLEIVALEGLLRVSTDLSMSRYTCDLKLTGGDVKSARAFFRF